MKKNFALALLSILSLVPFNAFAQSNDSTRDNVGSAVAGDSKNETPQSGAPKKDTSKKDSPKKDPPKKEKPAEVATNDASPKKKYDINDLVVDPEPDLSDPSEYTVRTVTKKSEHLLNSLVTISGQELVRNQVRTVSDALLLIPGAAPEYGTKVASRVSIDALPTDQITVLRDGIPVGRLSGGDRRGAANDYGQSVINPTDIERIEIKRGFGPNGKSGIVVNFISKQKGILNSTLLLRYAHSDKPTFKEGIFRFEQLINFEIPFAAFLDDSDSSIAKGLFASIDFGKSTTKGLAFNIDDDQDPNHKDPTNPSLNNYNGNLRFGWQRGANKLVLNANIEDGTNTTYGLLGKDIADYIIDTFAYSVALNGTWNFGDWQINHTTLFRNFILDYDKQPYQNGTPGDRVHRATTNSKVFNQTINTLYIWENHDLSLDFTFDGEWLDRTGDVGTVDNKFVGAFSITGGDHIYIGRTVDLEGQLRLRAGFPYGPRIEGFLSAGWRPNQHYLARISASRTIREPTVEELYNDFSTAVGKQFGSFISNPKLKPETRYGLKGEFGTRYKWIALTVSPFFHYVADVVSIAPFKTSEHVGKIGSQNRFNIMTAGLNTILEVNLPWNIDIRGTYTYSPLARLANWDELKPPKRKAMPGGPKPSPGRPPAKEAFNRISLRPEHIFSAEIGGRWLNNTLGARFWVTGRGKIPVLLSRNPLLIVSDDYKPAAVELNVGIDYSPLSWLNIAVDGRNLTNTVEPKWGPIVGRYVMATVTLQPNFQ